MRRANRRFLCTVMWIASCLHSSLLPRKHPIPADWCRPLPRPEYKNLERVPVSDPWFEVYKPATDVFAIYEPHQAEETIGYLIVGEKRALLFDTGMGISDIKKVTAELTKLPIVVINSHTHDDHVGGNWEFDTVYGMDTEFTRKNAQGSREDAQEEITPDQICGALPKGIRREGLRDSPVEDREVYSRWRTLDLGGRTIEVIATPGHTPDAISLTRSRQWAAVHWRHLLSRADLAVSAGNRSQRLCRFHPPSQCTGTAGQVGFGRAQYSGGIAGGAGEAGFGI